MGAYISQSDIEAVFGTQNVAAWSNVDTTTNPATVVAARITSAIAYAEGYVEDRLRQARYAVPFVATGSSFPVVLVDIMAKLAGAWLYTSRGIRSNVEAADNRVLFHKKEAEELIDLYAGGTRRMALTKSQTSGPTAPCVPGANRSGAAARWVEKGYVAPIPGIGCPPL